MADGKHQWQFEQPVKVPFIAQDQLEYSHGEERSAAAEYLITREFGDFGRLQISNTCVQLGQQTLVDIDQPDKPGQEDIYTQAWPADPNRGRSATAPPTARRTHLPLESVFRLRSIDNGDSLRIAVQTPLLHSQSSVIRQLLQALENYPAQNFEIDLHLCTDMSITGLGVLLLVQKNIGAGSERITITNGKPAVMQLMKWAGMEKYFTLSA